MAATPIDPAAAKHPFSRSGASHSSSNRSLYLDDLPGNASRTSAAGFYAELKDEEVHVPDQLGADEVGEVLITAAGQDRCDGGPRAVQSLGQRCGRVTDCAAQQQAKPLPSGHLGADPRDG